MRDRSVSGRQGSAGFVALPLGSPEGHKPTTALGRSFGAPALVNAIKKQPED